MSPSMSVRDFILLLLSGFGVYPITYLVVKWSRKLFFLIRQMNKNLDSDDAISNLGNAYAEEDPIKIRQADLQFAYAKLLKLNVTRNRSYRQRIADFQAVREMNLPANEYLLKLISDVLKNQSDFEMKYAVLSYYLQIKDIVTRSIFAWSIWFAALITGIYLFALEILDDFAEYQLILFVILTGMLILFPVFYTRNGIRQKVVASFFVLLLLFAYLTLFSWVNHTQSVISSVDEMGMQIERREWSFASPIDLLQKVDQCGIDITIKAKDGNSSLTNLPAITISPDAQTNLFDSACVPLFQGDSIAPGAAPRTAFVYKISPKNESRLMLPVTSLMVTVKFDDPVSTKTQAVDIEIKQEYLSWYYSKIIFSALFSVLLVGGAGNAISQAVKDSALKTLNPDRDKK